MYAFKTTGDKDQSTYSLSKERLPCRFHKYWGQSTCPLSIRFRKIPSHKYNLLNINRFVCSAKQWRQIHKLPLLHRCPLSIAQVTTNWNVIVADGKRMNRGDSFIRKGERERCQLLEMAVVGKRLNACTRKPNVDGLAKRDTRFYKLRQPSASHDGKLVILDTTRCPSKMFSNQNNGTRFLHRWRTRAACDENPNTTKYNFRDTPKWRSVNCVLVLTMTPKIRF